LENIRFLKLCSGSVTAREWWSNSNKEFPTKVPTVHCQMIRPGRDLAGASGARQYVTADQIARKCTGKQVTRLIVT
jgi:hypothetical protein